jgi:hypothetical protein
MRARRRLPARETGLDFLRESLSWVVRQLMEAEISELIGAARGERALEEQPTQRNATRAAGGAASGRTRARDPEAAPRQPLPELPQAAQPLRAGVHLGSAGGIRRRRPDQEGRLGARVARATDLEE